MSFDFGTAVEYTYKAFFRTVSKRQRKLTPGGGSVFKVFLIEKYCFYIPFTAAFFVDFTAHIFYIQRNLTGFIGKVLHCVNPSSLTFFQRIFRVTDIKNPGKLLNIKFSLQGRS